MISRAFLTVGGLVAVLLTSADAAPTPVPGGANAVAAVAGKVGQTVFNGVLRIKILALREATPADGTDGPTPGPNQKVMYMQALLHNGAHDTFIDLLNYTLADADAVAVDIPSHEISHINPNILQGAALKQTALFLVDKDFVPVKLIVTCATCGSRSAFRPVRFTVPAP